MRLIKHIQNKDAAYKVDYQVKHGKVVHFYGCWVNIVNRTMSVLSGEKLTVIAEDLDKWLEKDVRFGTDHKNIPWNKYKREVL